MCIVETKHFLLRWEERVGDYYPRMRKRVAESISRGKHMMHSNHMLGILVPVEFGGQVFCVVGVPENEKEGDFEFVLKSVLTQDQASRMGWSV